MNKNLNNSDFEKALKKAENSKDNRGVNYALPENATPVQIIKHRLCKAILTYQIQNDMSDEDLANHLNLSIAETHDILFTKIEEFTLDRLLSYAGHLLNFQEIERSLVQSL